MSTRVRTLYAVFQLGQLNQPDRREVAFETTRAIFLSLV